MAAVSRSGGIDGQRDQQTNRYIDRYGCSLQVRRYRWIDRLLDLQIHRQIWLQSLGIEGQIYQQTYRYINRYGSSLQVSRYSRVDRLADLQIQTGDRYGRILQVRWCRRIDRLADPQILYTYVHICTVHKQIRQHYSIQVMGYRRIDRLVDPQIYICVLQIDTVAFPRSDRGYENRGKDLT